MAGFWGNLSMLSGFASSPGSVLRACYSTIIPRFPQPDESNFSARMESSRDDFAKVATPIGFASSVLLGFVLSNGWQSLISFFHRMNNCITVACYGILAAWTMLPSVRHASLMDWSILLSATHYAVYQSLNPGRTAMLLGIPQVEHTVMSEVKIHFFLLMALAASLFAPVDLSVHAAICFIFPSVYVLALVILGTAFDALGIAQVSISFYVIALMVFLAARRHDTENRRSFVEAQQQKRRTQEILDLLSAVFDACFLVDVHTSEVLEHNAKLNHMFQQDMCGTCLSGATESDVEATRFNKYLATVHTHVAQQISIRFQGAREKFEASVIGTRLMSADGCLLIGIQRLTGETPAESLATEERYPARAPTESTEERAPSSSDRQKSSSLSWTGSSAGGFVDGNSRQGSGTVRAIFDALSPKCAIHDHTEAWADICGACDDGMDLADWLGEAAYTDFSLWLQPLVSKTISEWTPNSVCRAEFAKVRFRSQRDGTAYQANLKVTLSDPFIAYDSETGTFFATASLERVRPISAMASTPLVLVPENP